ncbi:MAG: histidine phosphatase family protein [Flavisolibacter sp.]|nr:histidine phosphatase family protein [Flavisolibacter sp.]
MMFKVILLSICFILFSCSTTYYIVRHAEKEPATEMVTDVFLSEEGKERAEALRDSLVNKDIKRIFSTNTLRTLSTARPLSEAISIDIETYDPADSSFITRLKQLSHGRVLIVGHSNTVDDLVNGLTREHSINGDLADNEYGDLFIVKRKGQKYFFERKHFGE